MNGLDLDTISDGAWAVIAIGVLAALLLGVASVNLKVGK